MKKLSIYPLTPVSSAISNYRKSLVDYTFEKTLSFYADRSNKMTDGNLWRLSASTPFEDDEHVMLCDNDYNLSMIGYLKTIDILNQKNVPVVLSKPFYDSISSEIDIRNPRILVDDWQENCSSNNVVIKELSTPVVSIMGQGENCDKLVSQIHLKTFMEKQGYKTLSICSNPVGKLFGMRLLPLFLYDNAISLTHKVIRINNLLHHLINREKPDVMIVGYPGGIFPHNYLYHNYFGELSYILSNAIDTDVGILNTYFLPDMNDKHFEIMSNICEFKFGTSLFSFVMANQGIDYDNEKMILKYKHYAPEYCIQNFLHVKSERFRLYNAFEKNDLDKMAYDVCNLLKSEIKVM